MFGNLRSGRLHSARFGCSKRRLCSLGAAAGDFEGVVEKLAAERTEPGACRVGFRLTPMPVIELQEDDRRAEYRQHTVECEVVDGRSAEPLISLQHVAAAPEPWPGGRHLPQAMHAGRV